MKTVKEILETELECVSRQDTPECDKDCLHCDLLMDPDEIKEAYKTAIKALEQTEWIPVKDKLPEKDVDVLTYHRTESFDYQYVSWIDDYSGKWCGFCGNLSDEVLAWRPLPDVPIIEGR